MTDICGTSRKYVIGWKKTYQEALEKYIIDFKKIQVGGVAEIIAVDETVSGRDMNDVANSLYNTMDMPWGRINILSCGGTMGPSI